MKPSTSVFYVDDDYDDLNFFREVARELQAEVEVFADGLNMLSKLQNPPPQASVVVVDLNMPTMDGYEVIKKLRSSEKYSDIPIVVHSTSKDRRTIEKCRLLGVNMYAPKSSTFVKLKNCIRQILTTDWASIKRNGSHQFTELDY